MKYSNGAIRAGRLVTRAGMHTCAYTKLHVYSVSAVIKKKERKMWRELQRKLLTVNESALHVLMA